MRAIDYSLVITVLVALLNGSFAQISLTISSPNGGLFGSGNEGEGDLSAGDNAGLSAAVGGEASNGYLPPIGSEPSSNVPAFVKPPEPEDSGREDDGEPTIVQPQFTVPAPQPQLGCAAALICVEEQYCTMLGIISDTPISLTEEQKLRRVPMVDCKNPDNGVIGKCCRDPNYVDPWPAGNLPANYSGGFDEQGFPSFLNLSKTKPKKPVKVVQSVQTPHQPFQPQQQTFQPLRPQSIPQPTKVIPQPTKPFQPFQPITSGNLQPQSSFQLNKVVGLQNPQVVQPIQHIPQTPVKQVVQVVQHHQQPQPFNKPAPFTPQQTFHTTQPIKTFAGFPSFPAFQDIPNQITQQINNLNPFNRPSVVDDTETVNAPADVPDVPLPTTTKRPGFFQDFPKPSFPSLPSLPSFPGFTKGQAIASTSVTANPPVIAQHTPGAQCGIINKVQHNGGLGDVDVAFGEIPWQAMILSNTEKKLLCSGAIVAPNLVMTAAHCVYGQIPSTVSIKAGEWKLGYELNHEEPLKFEIVQVAKIVPHPNYQPGEPGYDTAMLFLEHPIKLDLHVDTICVGEAPAVPQQQRKCISTGWGKTILQVHAAGALMHKIDVDLMSGDQCRSRIQGAESPVDIDDSLLCVKAHRQNNNMCQVDVGGPLACDRGDGNYELVGVYSQDTGCLPTNQVATFAKIDTKWVNAMINQGTPGLQKPQIEYGGYPAPTKQESKIHYHQPGVPCDCQQGTQQAGANQYLPPV